MKRIGEILVANGWVEQTTLDRALAKQREIPRRLCSLLIAGGVLEVDEASRALGEQLGVAAVLQKHLDHRDRSLAALIPAELARSWWVLPIGRMGNGDLIVCARDPRPAVLEALQAVLEGNIVLAVAPAAQVETLIGDTYGAPHEDFEVDMTTGPIASLDLDPLPDESDPMGGLSNLELVELDDQGVTRDPTQSGMLNLGPQRATSLSPSSAGIRIPTLPPPPPLPRPALPPTTPPPAPETAPPVEAAPIAPRPEIVVIDPPPRPPLKRASTDPVMIIDTPPSREDIAADAARPAGKTAAEQAAELAAKLPPEPAGPARLLARPEAPAEPVVIRPRRQTKPPAPAVDDGWDSPDVDARPSGGTRPPPIAEAAPVPPPVSRSITPLRKAPPVNAIARPITSPPVLADDPAPAEPPAPPVTGRASTRSIAAPPPPSATPPKPPPLPPAARATPPLAPVPVMTLDQHLESARPEPKPTPPTPSKRVDPDVIAAAYAVPPPAFDASAIAAGTVRPQRKILSLPASLPDTLAELTCVKTREAATTAAMRFAQGRWRAALLLQVKEKSALGEAGHGTLLTEDVVAGLAIPLAAPSIVAMALEARALTTELPRDDSPVQDRLDRLLGMPRFPAAAPVILGGYPAFVLVIGDPTADDTDAAMSDLDKLATGLAAAYARVTAG